jgi:chromodomain-helicase-DNA-binding protein 1
MDLDEILARAEPAAEESSTAGDELLNAFKVANFATPAEDDPTFWEKVIPKSEQVQKEEMPLYLPPRVKKTVQAYQPVVFNTEDSSKRSKKRKKEADTTSNRKKAKKEIKVPQKKQGEAQKGTM